MVLVITDISVRDCGFGPQGLVTLVSVLSVTLTRTHVVVVVFGVIIVETGISPMEVDCHSFQIMRSTITQREPQSIELYTGSGSTLRSLLFKVTIFCVWRVLIFTLSPHAQVV